MDNFFTSLKLDGILNEKNTSIVFIVGSRRTGSDGLKNSTESGSRRWPIKVFYNMLNLAGINSAILYKEASGEKLSRKDYPLSLVSEMQQTFKNTGATYEETDNDVEFQ